MRKGTQPLFFLSQELGLYRHPQNTHRINEEFFIQLTVVEFQTKFFFHNWFAFRCKDLGAMTSKYAITAAYSSSRDMFYRLQR